MTLTAAPTFHHPEYYSAHQSSYPQGNPPPYSEYDNQVQYLATQTPLNDSGYWENTRDDAVRLLNEQASSYVLNRRIYAPRLYHSISRSYQYPESMDWVPSVPSSSFQTRPFAHSVFQRTVPAAAYPTPPPPGISASSSSLAFALGGPPSQPKHLPPPLKSYQPQDSHALFYEDFLEQKTRQINSSRPLPLVHSDTLRAITPPPKAKAIMPEESPDPLAIQPHTAEFVVTPKKRKLVVELESPSIKRMHSMKSFSSHSGSQSTLPKTPQSKASLTPSSTISSMSVSVNTTPTVKRIVNLAYVSVPSSPWLTPSSHKGSTISDSRTGKNTVQDTPDDLGGYGSEDDVPLSPTKGRNVNDSVKSSARRTGDRDERGRHLLLHSFS